MGKEGKTAVELFGFVLAVIAVICLGASAMSFVNVFAGFAEGSRSTYSLIAIAALVLAVALGLLAGLLMSWSDPNRRLLHGRGKG